MSGPSEPRSRRFGPYELLERLGEGGMAEVWLARQEMEGVQRLLALKRMHLELQQDEAFVRMFLDEQRIALELSHPNIGHILDVGEIDGRSYLAMELLTGRDLACVLERVEKEDEFLPLEILCAVGLSVAAALDHAHTRTSAQGRPREIVHRDVSPDNVILTFDGRVKLVDFGIATAEGRLGRTQVGTLKGKPPYMAPEQVLGEPVDARTDLFSLGTLLYRAGVGRHPFGGSSPERVYHKVVEHVPRSLHRISPDFPEVLSELIGQAMAKDPDERPADAETFRAALEGIAATHELLISPKRIARWMLKAFPEAAEAQAVLSEDPFDERALSTTSYHVTAGKVPAVVEAANPQTVTARIELPELADEVEPATTLARLPPEARPDAGPELVPEMATAVTAQVPTAAEVSSETRFERVPEHRPRGAAPVRAPRRSPREPSPEEAEPVAPAVRLPPVSAARRAQAPRPESRGEEDWQLEDHWRHLPEKLRSPAAVGLVAVSLAALLFLAAVGLRTLLG